MSKIKELRDTLGLGEAKSKNLKDLFSKIRLAKSKKELDALAKIIDDKAHSGEIKFKDASKLLAAIDMRADKLGLGI